MKSCFSALAFLLLAGGFLLGRGADKLSGVAISPPNHGWLIQVSPDGSVRASFGSLPEHQIQMQQGSIDFSKLVEEIEKMMTDEIIPNGSQVALQRQGDSSHRARYLRDDQFLRRLFPSDPVAWKRIFPKVTKDMKSDGLYISPVSKQMADLMTKTPIFQKNTEKKHGTEPAGKDGTGQPATAPESKS